MGQHLASQHFLKVSLPWAFEASAEIESTGRVTLPILLKIIKTDGKDVTSYLFVQRILFEPGLQGSEGLVELAERGQPDSATRPPPMEVPDINKILREV